MIPMHVLTALELLQSIDDGGTFSGPWQNGPDEDEVFEQRIRAVLGRPESEELTPPTATSAPPPTAPKASATKPSTNPHPCNILPAGNRGDGRKFIACFPVGLEDDAEFCLVKRLLGKGGNNMKVIAEECNAKLRVRGIGSGYLEGSDHTEADIPLQIHVSCESFADYVGAIRQTGQLLRDLYKHHRRYRRSTGLDPIPVEVQVKELRRDDHGINLISPDDRATPAAPARKRPAKAGGAPQLARSSWRAQPKTLAPERAPAGRPGREDGPPRQRLPGPGAGERAGAPRARGPPSVPAPPPRRGPRPTPAAGGGAAAARPPPPRRQESREAAGAGRTARQRAIGAAAAGWRRAPRAAACRSPGEGAIGGSPAGGAGTAAASSPNRGGC